MASKTEIGSIELLAVDAQLSCQISASLWRFAFCTNKYKDNYLGPAGGPSQKMQPFSSPKGGSWSQAFHAWTVGIGDKTSLFVSTVFCGEIFWQESGLIHWCHIQRCRSFSKGVGPRFIVLESQPGKQNSRLKRSREITTEPIAEWVQTTKIQT